MDVQVRGESNDRELRRRQLARRLVFHQARTLTIFRLTGLSSNQQETLRRRWRIPKDMRPRGPAPTSFAAFRLRKRDEAAALAVFWWVLTGSQATSVPALETDAVEFGECICDVFEAYLACFPNATLEIEHLLMLVHGLDQGDVVAFSKCPRCRAAILVDPLKARRGSCSHCHRGGVSASVCRDSSGSAEPSEFPAHAREPVQQELF